MESEKKNQKSYAFLHKEIGEDTNAMRCKEYNHQNVNYYHLPKLGYYKPDAFNQPENLLEAFYIQNHIEPECQYCGSQF